VPACAGLLCTIVNLHNKMRVSAKHFINVFTGGTVSKFAYGTRHISG
jgi:hypothetical protein